MKLRGKVVKGAGRGRALGFPTANLDAEVDWEEGIYVCYAKIYNSPNPSYLKRGIPPLKVRGGEEGLLPSLIFVGAAKTFGETERRVEVYILDFDKDLYGQELEVEILKKLRGNMKFDSGDELALQMKKDESAAREFFNEKNKK